ncbi:hypothetical protein PQR66_18505 [Paraburkholderia agricolaris]|uniref:Uncharacterized protein n=1 Tax=Paraburkholderia agricolaris TaxID=2152888 RepID=A0ABW8ZP80_9BURK
MEKWLVILGIWAMCAVLFIRGATGGSGKRTAADGRARPASRASAGDVRAAAND